MITVDSIWVWRVSEVAPAGSGGAAGPQGPGSDITGFEVEGPDGHVGDVDEATYEPDVRGFLVVDTGFWIFGKKRMLPAGVVTGIDRENRKVLVSSTKDEIKAAPDYDELRRDEQAYLDDVASHYAYENLTGDPIAPTPGIRHVD